MPLDRLSPHTLGRQELRDFVFRLNQYPLRAKRLLEYSLFIMSNAECKNCTEAYVPVLIIWAPNMAVRARNNAAS